MESSEIVVAGLATYRATMLVTNDFITRPIRVKALKWCKKNKHEKLHYGITCPWCASVWVGSAVVGTGMASGAAFQGKGKLWKFGTGVLASSAITALLVKAGFYPNGNEGIQEEVNG